MRPNLDNKKVPVVFLVFIIYRFFFEASNFSFIRYSHLKERLVFN